jgi:hypothetical protein
VKELKNYDREVRLGDPQIQFMNIFKNTKSPVVVSFLKAISKSFSIQTLIIDIFNKEMQLRKTFHILLLALAVIQVHAQDFAKFNWTPMGFQDSYIDFSKLNGDKLYGFKLYTLTNYESISSAQMFGLAEVNEYKINCNQGTVQNLKNTWFEKPFAKGKTVKVFSQKSTPVKITDMLDGVFERDLFRFICK